MNVIKETNFEGLGKRTQGKVRDIYEQPAQLLLVTTDRHSSFDRIIAHIPHKGAVLNLISAFWFELTKDIVPNQLIEVPDSNVIVAKRAQPFLVEVVVRGYLTGVTDTSIWTNYQKGKRDFGGITLPDGMTKNMPLPRAIITPTTKAGHDENLDLSEVVPRGLATAEQWAEMQRAALALFARGQEHASSKGFILVDTKYEFGLHDGKVILIDEVHTPDNSRYWLKSSFEERIAKGEEPMAFDKEFLRIWFKENCDPYNDATLPEAPEEMVTELSRRYIEIYETLTGAKFSVDESMPPLERMQKNLEKYML
ncbi:MAG: phosphoribosylaminoimidazole-succinocarboxamide synthase [Parcubacteria group bacterium Greene0714_7]|nr:MAG: phosphoribosylaminoimidazole-succinocarboxamide synthase [Parcubacteria group bacterium Greene0714_7]